MMQSWGKLLFMHWSVPAEQLSPLLPAGLELDDFDGRAWIAVTPFTMWGIRLAGLPPLPGLHSFHELNVRTYVRKDGVPGVWFFSLDASSSVAVLIARTWYHLPYRRARMSLRQDGTTIEYSSVRGSGASPARLEAAWSIGEELPRSVPGSIEFFLTERYCLYSFHRGRLYRGRIHHVPWTLQRASLLTLRSTMLESHDLPSPQGTPLLHYAESIDVEIWPLTPA